jgi:hypothetical protein
MLSTRHIRIDNQAIDARAQHPLAARKAVAFTPSKLTMPSVPRSQKKAKRADASMSTMSEPPASPTSKLKPGRKARALTSPSQSLPSAPVPKKARARQLAPDTHPVDARPLPSPIAATDQAQVHVSPEPLLSDLVAAIRELYRRRQDFLNEEGSLSRRIKKIVARCLGQMTATDEEVATHSAVYSPLLPFLDSLKLLRTARKQEERKLKQHTEQLPVWGSFGDPIHNFGLVSLGQIIGEAGDLSKYSNPAKLWKRMGLGLVNGERQRKCLNKDAALEHGYSPRRRSVMFIIGDNLVKGKSAYRAVYDERKLFEVQKAEAEGLKVVPAAKIPKGKHAEYRSAGHIHLRAKRYMEKRLLRDLWRAWRDQLKSVTQRGNVDPGSPIQEAA